MLEVDHLRLLLDRVTTGGAHLLPGRAAQLETALEKEAAWRAHVRATVVEQLAHPLHVPPPADLTGQHATETAALPTGARTGTADAPTLEAGG